MVMFLERGTSSG